MATAKRDTTADLGETERALRTPEEWRQQLRIRASRHACARQLHGWHEHEHHEGVPIRISEAAYTEALEAAQKEPCIPSPNAVSPHKGRGR